MGNKEYYWSRILEEIKQKDNPNFKKCFVHFPEDRKRTDGSQSVYLKERYYFGDMLPDVYLTPRELECIQYLLQGFSYQKAADHMQISRRTVECYMRTVKEKLCCNNRDELIELMMRWENCLSSQ